MMTYIANFTFDGQRMFAAADSIQHLRQGFWITRDLEYTSGPEAHYWIPPCQIIYIEKREDLA